jgi:hypothetical protein
LLLIAGLPPISFWRLCCAPISRPPYFTRSRPVMRVSVPLCSRLSTATLRPACEPALPGLVRAAPYFGGVSFQSPSASRAATMSAARVCWVGWSSQFSSRKSRRLNMASRPAGGAPPPQKMPCKTLLHALPRADDFGGGGQVFGGHSGDEGDGDDGDPVGCFHVLSVHFELARFLACWENPLTELCPS